MITDKATSYAHILFDLDGTLTKSGIGIVNCFKYALSQITNKRYDEKLFDLVVGPPLSDSFMNYFGLSKEDTAKAISLYRSRYATIGIFENELYEGVFPMLHTLYDAGYHLLLSTSKPTDYAVKILEHFGILHYFSFVGAATMDGTRSQKKDVLSHTLMQISHIPKSQILMVGDRSFDLSAAAALGIDGAGVLYGYGSYRELSACPHVIIADSATDLLAFILKNKKKEVTTMTQQTPKELRFYLKDHLQTTQIESDQALGLPQPPLSKPYDVTGEIIDLPAYDSCVLKHNDLTRAIIERKSRRKFTQEPLSLSELSYLLYCSQGILTYRPGKTATLRTVPSAGARHPFETYLACMNVTGLKQGIYRYLPETHQLLLVRVYGDTLGDVVAASASKQIFVGRCAVTFFWTAVMYRSEWRYPTHAQKVVLIDAGHVCQNLYLACEAVGCGTCGIGAYDQKAADALCDVDGEEEFVIYLAPVGKL